jgi:ABC-type antimicrobial peptide transport system permease subunit
MLGVFSALALTLAAVGLYGVMAYATRRRTRELGVRLALGASRSRIARMVLRDALVMAGLGLVIGLPAALFATGFLEALLYGLSPTDAVTLAGVSSLIVTVAIAAAVLPARRAASVDPNVALRYE